MRRAKLVALCVVTALGASLTMPAPSKAGEQTLFAMMIQSVQGALSQVLSPDIEPAIALDASPIPLAKPSPAARIEGFQPDNSIARELGGRKSPVAASKPIITPKQPPSEVSDLPDGYEAVAQCGPATIISKPPEDGEPKVYSATFAKNMLTTYADEGCGVVQQGCNVCSVRYTGCDDAVKAACTDAACLAEKCERKVVCSTKRCTVEGVAPTCDSRIARTKCLKVLFDEDGPKAPLTSSKRN